MSRPHNRADGDLNMHVEEPLTEPCCGLSPPQGGDSLPVRPASGLGEASDRELLRALLDNLTDHIYFKDRASRFVRCSREQARRAGFSDPSELIGKTDHDIFTAEHADQALADEQRILRTGEPIVGKVEKETFPDGRVAWVLTTKVLHRDDQGNVLGTLGISKDITALKLAELKAEELDRRLAETSRLASMAEVATGVLHNVGNVLNSVNVSATLVADSIRHSRIGNLAKTVALIRNKNGNLADYFTHDPKGRLVPEYLTNLADHLLAENETLRKELAQLTHYVEHIKEIVAMQQSYARVAGSVEALPPVELVEDALRINLAAFVRHRVEVVRDFHPTPLVLVDKHKALQVLVNLLSNAKYALDGARAEGKRVVLHIASWSPASVRIRVTDNGAGISPENLARIFMHGFTTRKDGHGFGLHSGVAVAREMGGSLTAQSDGLGKGATFTLELPVSPRSPVAPIHEQRLPTPSSPSNCAFA